MSGKSTAADSWRTEYTDPKDIRWAFALPRTEEDFKRMRENSIHDGWPPRFQSHDGYNSKYPSWGGLFKSNPMTVQNFNFDEFDASDTSSQGSSGSTGSGGRPMRSKLTREPRVHHIPILVEGRGDSGGYTPSREQSPAPAPVQKPKPTLNPAPGYNNVTAWSSSDEQVGNRQPHQQELKANSQPPVSPSAPGGHFITKVAVNARPQSSVPVKEKKPPKPKADPSQQISEILQEKDKLREQVKAYTGTTRDKQYRYLDEMLTRCMLKLDDVNTDGRDDIRSERKDAVRLIQESITFLENKILENQKRQLGQNQQEQQEPSNSAHSVPRGETTRDEDGQEEYNHKDDNRGEQQQQYSQL